ncbi:MAG: CDP-diacylglycerol--serine O-phosphatidyltransferase [Gemmatimonadaceae bacterium]
MSAAERRPRLILLPNGFTLANLFFGVFAIVEASRGDFNRSALYIVLGGISDSLDGRIARATRTGSRFGSELDSLVDAISFGLAPALLVYFAVLNRGGWDWLFSFLFVACACIRLARFNIEQAGRAKTHFHRLPSPMAGMTLATYMWFSNTPLYTQTVIADLPWHVLLRYIMLGLSFLMISNVSYAAVPVIGYRSLREILGSFVVLGTIIGVIFLPRQFFFPALMAYVIYGLGRTVLVGLLARVPPAGLDEDEDFVPGAVNGRLFPGRRRRRRRRGTGHRARSDGLPPSSSPPAPTLSKPEDLTE